MAAKAYVCASQHSQRSHTFNSSFYDGFFLWPGATVRSICNAPRGTGFFVTRLSVPRFIRGTTRRAWGTEHEVLIDADDWLFLLFFFSSSIWHSFPRRRAIESSCFDPR